MLTIISCRGENYDATRFGAHRMDGQTDLFTGGPAEQPILVHGYNNPQARIVQDYGRLEAALGRECICYCWPGGDHPLEFVHAADRATLAGYRLRDVLSMRHALGAADVIVSHSLGARVSLTALCGCATSVKKLILMAPAVDWNVFDPGGEFAKVPLCATGEIHVLFSRRDSTLRLAFPLGDLMGDHHALGFAGPRSTQSSPPGIQWHDMTAIVGDHGDYLSKPECISLLNEMIGAKDIAR